MRGHSTIFKEYLSRELKEVGEQAGLKEQVQSD